MKIEEKTILRKPVSEYTGGRVLATNGLDILIGELNPEGDCVSEDCSGIHLCGITHFAKIDGFFPELAESDDDRIRKAIVATIHLYYGEPLEDEAKEMLAWIEKQEQKPTDNEMKEALRTEYEKGRADAIAEMQNLAWNEEDEEFLRRAINATKDAYPITAKWLKSLKGRVQPKQEWSKEDEERIIKNACEFMRNHIDPQLTIYHEQTWYKRDEFIEKFCKYMKGE